MKAVRSKQRGKSAQLGIFNCDKEGHTLSRGFEILMVKRQLDRMNVTCADRHGHVLPKRNDTSGGSNPTEL
jgi:hypothetical protein